MRVLILSAILAGACAAPAGEVAAVLAPAVMMPIQPLQTIPAGDIQAAAIDAKVAAEDQARALADQARAIADQARMLNEMSQLQSADPTNLKSAEEPPTDDKKEDSTWTEEEKKWQALEAVNIAHAKLQGSIASMEGELAANAEAIAKTMLHAPVVASAPVIAPVMLAAPGIVAPKPEAVAAPAIVAKSGEIREEMKEDKKEEKKELTEPEKALLKAQEELRRSEELFRAAMKPIMYTAPVGQPLALPLPAPWMQPLTLYQPPVTGFKAFALPHMPYLAHVV